VTAERQAVLAALRAAVELLEHAAEGERFLPLPEVARRLGLVGEQPTEDELRPALEYIRRELRDQLPVVRLNRTSHVVREESLDAYIRRREQLERRALKSA